MDCSSYIHFTEQWHILETVILSSPSNMLLIRSEIFKYRAIGGTGAHLTYNIFMLLHLSWQISYCDLMPKYFRTGNSRRVRFMHKQMHAYTLTRHLLPVHQPTFHKRVGIVIKLTWNSWNKCIPTSKLQEFCYICHCLTSFI